MKLCPQEDFERAGGLNIYQNMAAWAGPDSIICPDFEGTQIQGSLSSSNLKTYFLQVVDCGGNGFEQDDCETDQNKIRQFKQDFSASFSMVDQQIDFDIYDEKPIRPQMRVLQ